MKFKICYYTGHYWNNYPEIQGAENRDEEITKLFGHQVRITDTDEEGFDAEHIQEFEAEDIEQAKIVVDDIVEGDWIFSVFDDAGNRLFTEEDLQ